MSEYGGIEGVLGLIAFVLILWSFVRLPRLRRNRKRPYDWQKDGFGR